MAQFTISTYDKDFKISSIFGETPVQDKTKIVTVGKKISNKKDLGAELSL